MIGRFVLLKVSSLKDSFVFLKRKKKKTYIWLESDGFVFLVISRIASKPTGCLPNNIWLFGFDFSKLSNSYLVLLLFINLLLLLLYPKSMLFLQLFTLDVLLSWWLLLMCNGCCSLDARDDDSRRRCISRSNGDFGTPWIVKKRDLVKRPEEKHF